MRKKKLNKKKLVSAALCAVFILSSTLLCYAAADKEGTSVNQDAFGTVQKGEADKTQGINALDGTEVTINTMEDFLEFIENCRYDSWGIGKTVILNTDLKLDDRDFSGAAYFNGVFEGNGHTIENVSLRKKGSDLGFFRYLGEQAVISRLKIKGTIDPSGSGENIGGIVGVNYGTIMDCSFEGKVSGQNAVGGIAGTNRASGRISSCSSDAVILATNNTGGIAGKNEGTISECTSSSRINIEELETTQDLGGVDLGSLNLTQNMVTRNNMGGIAGSSSGTILSCVNRGTVGYDHTGYNAGGIAGSQSGVIGLCSNLGDIYGRKDVGGIVGQAEPYIESEYLDHRIEEIRGEINRLNQTLNSISSALSATSKEAREYAVRMSGQYDQSMRNISADLAGLSDSVARDYPEAQKYVANINGAMEQINSVQISGKEQINSDEQAVHENIAVIRDNLNAIMDLLSEDQSQAGDYIRNMNHALDEISSIKPGAEGITVDQLRLIQTNARSVIENLAGLSDALATEDPESQGHIDNIRNAAGNIAAIETAGESYTKEQAEEIQNQLGTIGDNLGGLQGAFADTGDSAKDMADRLADELNSNGKRTDIVDMVNTIDNGLQSVSRSISSAVGQVDHIMDSVSGDMTVLTGDEAYVEDISSIENAETMNGVISGSSNRGEIHGDLNAGGIAGTMNVEYGDDPEFDLDLTGKVNIILRSTVNNVVIHSINYGAVSVKKNCAGGITGSQELGLIYDCEGYGTVISDSGSYLGGIAGKSAGAVQKSYSLCNISGNDFLGGICGNGSTVIECISISSISGDGEKHGSIAGSLEEEGSVKSNYFVGDWPDGIDGVSYTGAADRMSYEEVLNIDGVPKGFQTVTVTFQADGQVLGEKILAYGSAVTQADFPKVPEKEGFYIKWPEKQELSKIVKNTAIIAEYRPWTESVAGEKDESGHILFLAAGEFYEDTSIKMEDCDGPELKEGSAVEYAYDWMLKSGTKKNYETVEGRFYAAEQAGKTMQVWIKENNGWSRVNTIRDGSYLVAEIPYAASFAVISASEESRTYLLAGCAAIAVILVIFWFTRHNKKKASCKKET